MDIEWYFETICFPSLHQLYDACKEGSIEKDLAISLAGAICIADEEFELNCDENLKEKVDKMHDKFCSAVENLK